MSEPFYILGHRGAAGEYFENSMQGFAHALEIGVDMIELDIREHRSELWVFHDAKLERLTDASGAFAALDDPGAVRLLNDEPIPKLEAVLDLVWGRVPLNIEIKSITRPALLLELLARYPQLSARNGLPWILIS